MNTHITHTQRRVELKLKEKETMPNTLASVDFPTRVCVYVCACKVVCVFIFHLKWRWHSLNEINCRQQKQQQQKQQKLLQAVVATAAALTAISICLC